MKHTVKGLYGIPSMIRLGQKQRVCSQAQHEHEILSELAQLSREKTWLNKEKKNWQERINRISERMLDIEKMEELLIQKQKAMKEQMTLDTESISQTSDKEAHEMIIKY